jgi:aminocarboxymuconate-semialdehyde decarboxylase
MMKIDIHNHQYPENYWKTLLKISERVTFPVDVRRIMSYYANKGLFVKPEETIFPLEKLGIGIQVLSLSNPNVYMPEAAMSLDLAQMANDAYVEIRQRFPGKFFVLASVPLNFPELAVKELDRAIGKLGMNGIVLGSNIAGKPLSSPEFFPFYERVNELKLPIFIHPMSPPHMEENDEFFTAPLIHYIFESTLAVTKMVFAGVFERFPNIIMVLPHLGGAIPYLQGRIDGGYRNHPPCRKNISKKPSEYFKEFYYDTISLNVPALRCALEIVGPEHLVFGTDYPFQPLEGVVLINESIDALGLSAKDREAIEYRNLLSILHNT